MMRPSSDPDNTYAPMARRPDKLECGIVHTGHHDPPCCLVGWMMHEYDYEHKEQMHVHTAPDANDGGKPWAPWSRSMSKRMDLRWDQERQELVERDEPEMPFRAALSRLRRWCAGKHRMLPDHRGEPVCWMLVRAIVQSQNTVRQAALELEMTPERARRLLHGTPKGAADLLWVWVAERVNEIDVSFLRDSA